MKNTYWNGDGTEQAKSDELHKLIPDDGPCPKHSPKLERLRKAANAYYRLNNDGDCTAFTRIFGVPGSKYLKNYPEVVEAAELKLTRIILDAYTEQFQRGALRGDK